MRDQREFDVILWGATGFTGTLVAEYLAEVPGVRFALGGRNRAKLDELQGRFGSDVGVVVADSNDAVSLAQMCARTRVIISTVGPYARLGAPLVAAAIEAGTDYCDLTGEPQFIRAMIDAHHDEAAERGVRIVHCCGFDSIPSDLGVLFVQTEMLERTGALAHRVEACVTRLRTGASGGTLASAAATADDLRADPSLRRIIGHPFSLNPPDKRDLSRPRRAALRHEDDGWRAPFVMAVVNEKIVNRSHALLHPQEPPLDYTEESATGPGAHGFARAVGLTGAMAGLGAVIAFRPARNFVVSRFLPAPGEGPSRETIANGHYEFEFTASREDTFVRARVWGNRDPGYGDTAKMLGESALCLAFDEPGDDVLHGGVLTPASALGTALIGRLQAVDINFQLL